jgi:predicted acyltransferase
MSTVTAPRATAAAAPPGLARGRLTSLDAFRGATIAAMILVNNPGSWSYVYAPLRHAEWHGWTPTDLIFPFFLFIIGVAIPISFGRRRARGDTTGRLARHVVRRSLILFGLGAFMAAFPSFSDWGTFRIMGVLQRIGVVYLLASGAYLAFGRIGRGATIAVLLLGYWALMSLVPVPGYGAGDLSPEGNLAAYLDRLILSRAHLWGGRPWDPEGLLSSLPAVATVLVGTFVGEWIVSDRGATEKVRGLLAASAVAVAIGLIWGVAFPINKNLWTSSYVVFTAGAAGLILAGFYWLIEMRGRRAWSRPFVFYGMNAISVFVGSGLLSRALIRTTVGAGDASSSLYSWIYARAFVPWVGPMNGSLAFALAHVGFWLGVAWLLYRRRIFIKI